MDHNDQWWLGQVFQPDDNYWTLSKFEPATRQVLYSGATRPLIRPPGRQRIAYLLQFVLLSLITNHNFQTFLITTNQKPIMLANKIRVLL